MNRRIAIAPMMKCTDRHFRYLARLLTRHTLLYTEMLTPDAIILGYRQRLLGFSPEESPIALQLGGSDPQALAEAASIAEQWGYDEINLNIGCPSDRVQSGAFGACLMKDADRVAACVEAIASVVQIPVTVKTRIGVDQQDSEAFLHQFIQTVAKAPCHTFIIHARKAWLKGLSPRENREIPPLNYSRVYRLKHCFPQLEILINGGIHDDKAIAAHLKQVDGVMIGRKAYHDPYFMSQFDTYFSEKPFKIPSRETITQRYLAYADSQYHAHKTPIRLLLRPLIGLYRGQAGGKRWRRSLTEGLNKPASIFSRLANQLSQLP